MVLDSKILKKEEIVSVFKHLNSVPSSPMAFPLKDLFEPVTDNDAVADRKWKYAPSKAKIVSSF